MGCCFKYHTTIEILNTNDTRLRHETKTCFIKKYINTVKPLSSHEEEQTYIYIQKIASAVQNGDTLYRLRPKSIKMIRE